MESKCLYLDRDGVVNRDYGYVHRVHDLEFVDGIFDICRLATEVGFKIVIVTNQSGIERGLFTEGEFEALMHHITNEFEQRGCPILDYLYSPHMPVEAGGGTISGYQRKPSPQMIEVAAERHGITLEDSILIGDNVSDIQAGIAAGIGRLILVNRDDILPQDNIHANVEVIGNLREFRPEWLSSANILRSTKPSL